MKKTVKKIMALVLASGLSIALAGCGSNAKETVSQTPTDVAKTANKNEKTTLIFWHSMGGAGGDAIKKIVADFNQSQEEIEVVEQYQGSYDEAITKLKSTVGSDQAPNIMQLYDIGTRWMIDSGYVVPIQELVDANQFDLSSIEPNIAAYYSVNDTLYSMPFNSSTPMMYYNKDAFKAAGLDADNPPQTFQDLALAATKLTKPNEPGMTMRVYSWFFEQYLSKQGKTYANNGNGRQDKATAVEFDTNGGGINFLSKIDEMTKQGINGNMGRDEDAIFNAFFAGKTSIVFGSTASLTKMIKNTEGVFELGAAPLPKINANDKGGVSVGGGSLWIMDKGDEATKNLAWKFMAYVVSPEVQVYWNEQTGYFPITTKAYELDGMKKRLEENPLFQVAIDQLHDSSPADVGALLGVFTEARNIVESNWEEMNGGKQTPEQVIKNAAQAINKSIEQYNIANE